LNDNDKDVVKLKTATFWNSA